MNVHKKNIFDEPEGSIKSSLQVFISLNPIITRENKIHIPFIQCNTLRFNAISSLVQQIS